MDKIWNYFLRPVLRVILYVLSFLMGSSAIGAISSINYNLLSAPTYITTAQKSEYVILALVEMVIRGILCVVFWKLANKKLAPRKTREQEQCEQNTEETP
jgi:hypothetical protein